MRRLILLRHGKSAWDDLNLSDHDRPLNKRGQKSCVAIAKWLDSNGYLPDSVVSSTSIRTVETWDRIAGEIGGLPEATLVPDLYLADPEILLRVIRDAKGHRLALLAHNPGIAELAHMLPMSPPSHPDFGRFPTLGAFVVDFDIDDWRDLSPGTGRSVDFVVPRDLID